MSKSPASWSGRATLAELKSLGIDPNVSGMASAALRLAAALDEGSAPTSISALTREYRPIMTTLRKGAAQDPPTTPSTPCWAGGTFGGRR